MITRSFFVVYTFLFLSLAGCTTLSGHDKNTIAGAGVGAVSGAILTGGSSIGTVGGAAIGGYIAHQIDTGTSAPSKHKKQSSRDAVLRLITCRFKASMTQCAQLIFKPLYGFFYFLSG